MTMYQPSVFAALAASTVLSPVDAVLPAKFLDPHYHYYFDTTLDWATYVNSLVAGAQYFPENYTASVVNPIVDTGVEFLGDVIMEALPDGGVEEVKWIQGIIDPERFRYGTTMVGSCDLTVPVVDNCLEGLVNAGLNVTSVRWLLLPGHSSRVNGKDLLEGGLDGEVYPAFEEGYAKLADYGLSFDLQCLPEQLPAFTALAKRHQDVPVCVNHLGRLEAWPADADAPNKTAIQDWYNSMKELALLPNIYVKISMLGHMVPDWFVDEERKTLVKELVLTTVELFGPERCMVNTNWWLNAAVADSDGVGTEGPEPVEFLETTMEWFEDYTEEERDWLYWGSASMFYLVPLEQTANGDLGRYIGPVAVALVWATTAAFSV